MISRETKEMMLEIYERERRGEIDINRRDNLLKLIKESSEFIQSNIERLERQHKEGKLSDEDFEKQVKAWKARESNYEENIRKERLQKEEEEKKLSAKSKKLMNRIGNKVSSAFSRQKDSQASQNKVAMATESILTEEEYCKMRYALYEKEGNGEIDIFTRDHLLNRLDEIYLSNI